MKFFVSLFFLLLYTFTFSQQFTNWNNYSDMKNTRDLVISSDVVWCATNGGAYSYSLSNNEFDKEPYFCHRFIGSTIILACAENPFRV